jgi:glutamine amidotransferase
MEEILLIDAGTGNLRSVQKALESLGAHVRRTDDPRLVARGRRVILPGVGAFGDFMSGLRASRLDAAVKEIVARGVPLLGICVGMQALFEEGEEMGRHTGLGLLPGRVQRFPESPGLKVPHTGWNQLEVRDAAALFAGVPSGSYAYFNHSFYCDAGRPSDVAARVRYGFEYAGAVQCGNLYGVQFHPEKSQRVGLRILRNFLEAV